MLSIVTLTKRSEWRGSVVVAWHTRRHVLAFPMQKEMDVGCQGDGSRRPTEQGSIRPRPRHRFVPSTGIFFPRPASFASLRERNLRIPEILVAPTTAPNATLKPGVCLRNVNRKACIYSSYIAVRFHLRFHLGFSTEERRTKDVWGEKINGKSHTRRLLVWEERRLLAAKEARTGLKR